MIMTLYAVLAIVDFIFPMTTRSVTDALVSWLVGFCSIMPPVVPTPHDPYFPVTCGDCCICLEGSTDAILPACGHRFHRDCILKWAECNNTCPMCRRCMVFWVF